MKERKSLVGTQWDWTAESGTQYQLLWLRDTGRMMLGVRRVEGGQWYNTTCTLEDGSARRFTDLKDARAWARSFVEEETSA